MTDGVNILKKNTAPKLFIANASLQVHIFWVFFRKRTSHTIEYNLCDSYSIYFLDSKTLWQISTMY